jgi:predicted DNA-binding ribbon-helix-helix protein
MRKAIRRDDSRKRSVVVDGERTSVSLEDPFWQALKRIASVTNMTPSALLSAINADCGGANLSSAARVYVLQYYQAQANQRGPQEISPA